VFYQKSLVNLINDNVQKIGAIILIFSALMLFVAIVLINNTIRISVYSKRFIINTMKLVGATWGFIRKPFLLKSMLHGFYAAVVALGMLTGVIYLIQHEFYEVINLGQIELMVGLSGLIIILGVTINLISTSLAVGKYLRLSSDELYY